jgi:hypothetical protein
MITPSGAYVHAQQFVTTHYADWNVAYPIDFRQYYKKGSQEAEEHGFRTKIVLACELVDDAIEKGCPAHTFVFDRWYLCKTLTDHIKSHGRNWIGAVKSNRVIHYKGKQMSIGNFARSLEEGNLKHVQLKDKEYWALSRVVLVNNLGKVTIVVAWDNNLTSTTLLRDRTTGSRVAKFFVTTFSDLSKVLASSSGGAC